MKILNRNGNKEKWQIVQSAGYGTRIFRFLLIGIFFLSGCVSSQTSIGQNRTPTRTPSEKTSVSATKTPTITQLPTLTPTVTLAPMGTKQSMQDGYYYLGDPDKIGLGFNLHAGGAIGSLKYFGIEMIDDEDYGRYIQFSPYDREDEYICNSSSCFSTWGWNPLQAGSADGTPAQVLDFRLWENGLYIKAPGIEWGYGNGISDVIYEFTLD
jgi:hypothetical protein